MQERVERSAPGRAAISVFVLVTLVLAVAYNLPASHLRDRLLDPGERYLNALGLDQNWGVFAPDPRKQVIRVTAEIRYPGPAARKWRVPDRGTLIGGYSDYRWKKYAENVHAETNADLPEPLARWLARTERLDGQKPTAVQLKKADYDNPPPGKDAFRHDPFREQSLYTLPLAGGVTPDAVPTP